MTAPVFVFKVTRKRLRAVEALDKLDNAASVAALHRRAVEGREHCEHFAVAYLDSSLRVLGYELVAIGAASEVRVSPTEVFRGAILAGAHAVIVSHNHPSGSATPSDADDELTKRLMAGGEMIGVRVLDHVVVTETDHWSYAGSNKGA